MGRRAVLGNMPKLLLPSVSWVALLRLLKKAPKNLPTFTPSLGAEVAIRALLRCHSAPHTDSLRYTGTDDYSADIGRRPPRSGRRPKSTALLGRCSSRPLTDSFRVHHVVNQEALQLMLNFSDDDDDADLDHEARSEELCYGIIRDCDRLLHDDIYTDESARASSCMRTCSSSLSATGSRSLAGGVFCAALSRNSVDSEALYSTANSASFSYAPSTLLHAGSHTSFDSRPSSSIISSSDASELIYSDLNLDLDLKLETGEEVELAEDYEEAVPEPRATEDACALHHRKILKAINVAEIYNGIDAVHVASSSVGNVLYEDDDDAGGLSENYEGDAEEEEVIVAEMRYSEDPLQDFMEAISRMVVRQQLNEAAQLQELYGRFLRLNAPCHHHTITLAFLQALQRLASFEPRLLHTLI